VSRDMTVDGVFRGMCPHMAEDAMLGRMTILTQGSDREQTTKGLVWPAKELGFGL
jgi:hypothetical protein